VGSRSVAVVKSLIHEFLTIRLKSDGINLNSIFYDLEFSKNLLFRDSHIKIGWPILFGHKHKNNFFKQKFFKHALMKKIKKNHLNDVTKFISFICICINIFHLNFCSNKTCVCKQKNKIKLV